MNQGMRTLIDHAVIPALLERFLREAAARVTVNDASLKPPAPQPALESPQP